MTIPAGNRSLAREVTVHSALDQTSRDSREKRRKARAPVAERVAGWSARHRKTAVFGWLLLVAGHTSSRPGIGSGIFRSTTPGRPGRPSRP